MPPNAFSAPWLFPLALLACNGPDTPADGPGADSGEVDQVGGDTGGSAADTAGWRGPLVINEFLAYGTSEGYAGGADWIEIHNLAARDWDLSDTRLWADDGTDQLPWMFPSGRSIAGGELLVVICDETNQSGEELHASFRIGRQGGRIELYNADRSQSDTVAYDYQQTGWSSARVPDGSSDWVEDDTPTPGASNDGV